MFINLKNHSYYSFLSGVSSPKQLAKKAKDFGQKAVGITDFSGLYGALDFYLECEKQGVKAIIGAEMFLAPRKFSDKENRSDGKPFSFTIFAKNNIGYKNLTKLCSIAHLEGFYYKARIDFEILEKNSEGLIGIENGIYSKLGNLFLENETKEKIKKHIEKNLEIFGKENYFLGITDLKNTQSQIEINQHFKEIAEEMDLNLVALKGSFYSEIEENEAQDVLSCIAGGRFIDEGNRTSLIDEDYSFLNTKDAEDFFSNYKNALENTEKIAEMCNVSFELGKYRIPDFEVPEDFAKVNNINSPLEYFRFLCLEGLKKRYEKFGEHLKNINFDDFKKSTIDKTDLEGKEITNEEDKKSDYGMIIAKRFEYEYFVIKKMGFESYFLMVGDYCDWAKSKGILVGPGRGSGAGSIIAFALRITNLNPLEYGLLFERFLNPERVSMPDFDIDFEDEGRADVINYVSEKYGKNRVAQISTFGTLAAKASVKDVGRVFGVSFAEMNDFSKMISDKPGTSLSEAMEENPDIETLISKNEELAKVWDIAKKIEGNIRHISVHACAVVISDVDLDNYTSLQHPPKDSNTTITQFSAKPLEKLGLLKMDFLGLKNLSILKEAVKMIKIKTGKEIDIDKIPMDDEKTFELFQRGETTGIFQFESPGMKRYLKELKPTEFEDLIAMNSLYRPGPMEFIPNFIEGKHNPKKVKYPHKSLENLLKTTYGIAVYQEQILLIAQIFAGYSLGQADILRRAIGKKIVSEMASQREKFIEGAVKMGNIRKNAEYIFDDIVVPFAGYGFNKSHAAAYSMIAYQTAYLKANFPELFMTAILICDQGNTEKIAIKIEECREMKIKVLAPDVNESVGNFTSIGDKKIRFGLSAIKSLGESGVEEILKEREKNGNFTNIIDFVKRISPTNLNKKNFEALIHSGSLDSLIERKKTLANMLELTAFSKEKMDNASSGQIDLFGMIENNEEKVEEFSFKEAKESTIEETLNGEKEYLGLFVSMHPLAGIENFLMKNTKRFDEVGLKEIKEQKLFHICGVLTQLKELRTKKGDLFVVYILETVQGKINGAIFPKYYTETVANILIEGGIFLMKGKFKIRNGNLEFSGENIFRKNIEEMRKMAQKDGSLGDNKNLQTQIPKKIPALLEEEIIKANKEEFVNKEFIIKLSHKTQEENINNVKIFLLENPGGDEIKIEMPNGKIEIFPKKVKLGGKEKSHILRLLKI